MDVPDSVDSLIIYRVSQVSLPRTATLQPKIIAYLDSLSKTEIDCEGKHFVVRSPPSPCGRPASRCRTVREAVARMILRAPGVLRSETIASRAPLTRGGPEARPCPSAHDKRNDPLAHRPWPLSATPLRRRTNAVLIIYAARQQTKALATARRLLEFSLEMPSPSYPPGAVRCLLQKSTVPAWTPHAVDRSGGSGSD